MSIPASAFEKPHHHDDLPDIDRRSTAELVPEERLAATSRLRERLPSLQVDYEAVRKTPKAIVARDGFLSGPRGRGRGIAPQIADGVADPGPLHPLKSFLREHKQMFGHADEALDQARVKRQHVGKHNGLRSYAWQQQFEGLDVAGAVFSAHITKDGELVSVSSGFLPDPAGAAAAGTPNVRLQQLNPAITAEEAVRRSAENLDEHIEAGEIVARSGQPESRDQKRSFKAGNLPGEAEAKLVWLPLGERAMRLCWEVELTRRVGGERFRLHLDAESGELFTRTRLTRYLADATYRVFTSDSPSPFSPGHPIPLTNQPPLVERSLLTIGALSTNASPTGWIHPGDNETRGNNVDAHLDRNADDLPDLPRPHGNPFRVFDFPIDFSRPPSTYSDAAVLQLFYWCNWMHDVLYDLGFTESAGNFQKDNFGRGGLGNDPIMADAQDGSGTDNANFTPTPDGTSPKIQMYVFTGPDPDRDGDFDAEIIIHEYMHGLTERLVGGGGGLFALQSGGLGEGWSDFYALALLSESTDDPHAAYPMGGYATDQFRGLTQNYYFGIRRYPYSTDLSKNPLTFKDIDPTQAIPHTGVPLNPIDTFNPLFAAQVHNQGELWCVTLWEMRANLIARHGFAGNRIALQIVTDALKLTPRNPNFLQARDAIILADQVNNGGANFTEIWRAFAKRGMGFSATSPDSSTTIGLVEAYDLPDALLIVPAEAFVSAGVAGGSVAPQCKTYVVTNHSEFPVTWTASSDETWIMVTPAGGSLAPRSGTSVTVCVNAASLGVGSHAATVNFLNETTGVAQEREVSVRIMAFTSLPFFEDFESGQLGPHWQVTGTEQFRVQVTDQNTPRGQRHLTMDNTGNGVPSRNEVSLGVDLAGFTNVVLRFWAKQFGDEPDGPPPSPFIGGADFDGVAISVDGVQWYEVQSLRSLQGNYSEWQVNLDDAVSRLGLSYNQHFRIRFNEFDNFSIPLDGIAIDDVRITGLPVRRLVVELPEQATEGDAPIEGRVTLGVARATDLEVQLASSDTSLVRVPPSVIIPAGSTQAVFAVTVVEDTVRDGSQRATVTAAAPGFFATPGAMTIHDNESNRLWVTIWPHRGREGEGLRRRLGIIWSQVKPARDVRIELHSSDDNELRVPAAVTLPRGRNWALFDLMVVDDTRLDGAQKVTVTAHVENWRKGSAFFEVLDNDVPGLQVALPARASEGNGLLANAGQVRLLATLQTNITVALASSDKSELTVPPSVVVPAGTAVATFDVVIADDSEFDGGQFATLTAAAPHHPPASATIEVLDDETPPEPYQPEPAHQATGVPVTADLAWLGGVGELLRNGDFETGDFLYWGLQTTGLGGYFINDGTYDPQSFDGPAPPYEGKYSALTDQTGGGHHVLYQECFIPTEARGATLSWVDKIRNHSTQYDFNQFFRVEIRDTADDLMEVAFSTAPGFPLTNNWTSRSFDLSRYRGQTIRIAFVEEDHQGYLNVHLDNISVWLEDNGVTTFDVYLGTNAVLTSQDFLGNTRSNMWLLPDLALSTTYHWQIVSRRGGVSTAGSVWSFTTRGIGIVDHFEFGPVAVEQTVGLPFAATLEARDDINNIATAFAAPVQLRAFRGFSNWSAVVITEIDAGNTDRIELQNVSGRRLDLSNWQIVTYDTRSWPAPRGVLTLPTNTFSVHGAIFTVAANGTAPGRYPAFFTGTNSFWGFAAVSNHIAVLVRDANGEPVDFVCAADARSAQISNPIQIAQDEWSGLPIPANTNSAFSYQRVGSVDRGRADDWIATTNSFGRKNAGLNVPFAPRHPVELAPASVSNFVAGVWSGDLTFGEPVDRITIVADDGQRHFGVAGPFTTSAANDISLSAADLPDVVTVADDLTYRFTIRNTGPGAAAEVVFSNRPPAELEFVSASASQGACAAANGEIVCDIGEIAPGANAIVTVVMRPTLPGVITNAGFVSRSGADGYSLNNRAMAESTAVHPVLSTGPVTVNEGNTNTTNLVFTLRLSAPSRLPVSVAYQTSDFTALAGADYEPASGTLTFPPGTTNRTLSVVVKGDRLDEFLEQFNLDLSAPVNCTIATPQVRGRITDDDPTPTLTISDATVLEPAPGGSTNVEFTVRLSAPSGLTVLAIYTTTNATALAPRDFFTEFGQVEFPPGITNRTISVRVNGDTIFESNEVFHVRLFGLVNALLADGQGSATIIDNGFVDLHHFKWEPIPSPQIAGVPFAATITARDGRDELFRDFNGLVRVSGVSASRTTSVGSGTNTWTLPMGTLFHDARTQVIYLADEIGAAGKINALSLNVTIAPGQVMSNWTIRLKHTPLTGYSQPLWEGASWTVVYRQHEELQGTGWTTFFFDQPFDYDGTNNLLVDLSFDNPSYTFDGLCAAFIADRNRSVHFQTDGAFGDPLAWSANNGPPAQLSRRVPQVQFRIENFVEVAPQQVGPFVSGSWTGQLTVLEPGTNVILRALHESGRNGSSEGFAVNAGAGAPSLRILTVALSGGKLRIRFPSAAGSHYRIESAESLSSPKWAPVADNVAGTGGIVEVIDSEGLARPQRFYRIVMPPSAH